MRYFVFSLLSAFCFAVGCTSTTPDNGEVLEASPPGSAELETMKVSTRNDVRWLRYRAFENRLGEALILDSDELCQELGIYSCVDAVHLVALGGNDPFDKGLYEALESPAMTTPIAVERMVVSACSASVEKEAAAEQQFVFLDLDLAATELNVSDPQTDQAISDTITSLYRRLHARNPLPGEEELVRELLVDDEGRPIDAKNFAKLACFAIASTTEAVFY